MYIYINLDSLEFNLVCSIYIISKKKEKKNIIIKSPCRVKFQIPNSKFSDEKSRLREEENFERDEREIPEINLGKFSRI